MNVRLPPNPVHSGQVTRQVGWGQFHNFMGYKSKDIIFASLIFYCLFFCYPLVRNLYACGRGSDFLGGTSLLFFPSQVEKELLSSVYTLMKAQVRHTAFRDINCMQADPLPGPWSVHFDNRNAQ